MNDKKHIYYFDYLRTMAVVCVIYMHVAADPLRAGINPGWHGMNLLTCFSFTAVPLFFMMSGFLLLSSERTLNISVLLKKRIPHLLVPLAAWTVAAVLRKLYITGNQTPAGLYEGLVSSLADPAWVHLWYMYTLIAIYAISPILYGGLHSLDKKGHIYVLILIGLVSAKAMLQSVLPDSLDRLLDVDLITKVGFFGNHLCTFVLGFYLGSMKRKLPNWLLVAAAGLLLAVITFGTYYLTQTTGNFNQTFQNQSAGFEVLLAACVFLLFKQNMDRASKFLERVPVVALSLSIYLMHCILLSVMLQHYTVSTFFDTVYITLLNLVICFFSMKTAATVKPVCFLATGMTYKAACGSCNWIYTYNWIKDFANRRRQQA